MSEQLIDVTGQSLEELREQYGDVTGFPICDNCHEQFDPFVALSTCCIHYHAYWTDAERMIANVRDYTFCSVECRDELIPNLGRNKI